jgi:hypothetical protein
MLCTAFSVFIKRAVTYIAGYIHLFGFLGSNITFTVTAPLLKASAAGLCCSDGIFSFYFDVSFAAATVFVISAPCDRTIQYSHLFSPFLLKFFYKTRDCHTKLHYQPGILPDVRLPD